MGQMQLQVRALNPWFLPSWWDANIARAGAGFEQQSPHVRLKALRRFGRIRALCVHAAGSPDRPLAHCLATRTRDGWVIEQLILTGGEWAGAMHAVLAHLGAGEYVYGHVCSLEPTREGDLTALAGVEVGAVQPITVHVIENGQWASDADWLADISTNVKRNLKRASGGAVPVSTRWRQGRGALRDLHRFTAMRGQTMHRLGTPLRMGRELIRRGLNWLAMPKGLVVGIAAAGPRALAALVGYEVGSSFYYTMGGSGPDNNGASWTVLVEAVLRWRARHPAGRFVMGYLDETLEGVQRDGLLRQRTSLRKSDHATALVQFVYRPVG